MYDNSYIRNMTMIREAIIKRMDELNLNPNQLSEMLKGKIPRQTIYDFLREKEWRDTRTEVASALMKALGLKITKEKRRKKVTHGKRNK